MSSLADSLKQKIEENIRQKVAECIKNLPSILNEEAKLNSEEIFIAFNKEYFPEEFFEGDSSPYFWMLKNWAKENGFKKVEYKDYKGVIFYLP